MLKSTKQEYRTILKNMEYLDGDLALSKKFKRRREKMTVDEYNEYARKAS
jgi:hypothetical protein